MARYGLARVLDIQQRARVDLINDAERSRILELIAANTWPNKWVGDEINGAELIDAVVVTGLGDLVIQPTIF